MAWERTPTEHIITSDPAEVQLYSSVNLMTGRPQYVFHLSAESAGNAWDATFEVYAQRYYVAFCR